MGHGTPRHERRRHSGARGSGTAARRRPTRTRGEGIVKKAWIIAAGMLVLGGAIVVTSKLTAQPTARPAAPQTKIALINLSTVIKDYKKYQQFQNDVKATIEKYQDNDKKIRAELKKAADALATPGLTEQQKGEWEKYAKAQQRLLEDNQNEAKMVLGKKSDEQMIILYREVRDACERYAQGQG